MERTECCTVKGIQIHGVILYHSEVFENEYACIGKYKLSRKKNCFGLHYLPSEIKPHYFLG